MHNACATEGRIRRKSGLQLQVGERARHPKLSPHSPAWELCCTPHLTLRSSTAPASPLRSRPSTASELCRRLADRTPRLARPNLPWHQTRRAHPTLPATSTMAHRMPHLALYKHHAAPAGFICRRGATGAAFAGRRRTIPSAGQLPRASCTCSRGYGSCCGQVISTCVEASPWRCRAQTRGGGSGGALGASLQGVGEWVRR